MSTSSRQITIAGGTIVTPTETIDGGFVRTDGRQIVSVGTCSDGSPDVDARGQYVLPGFVDLHCDDIESHLFPRADERVELPVALDRCDVASVSAGVTTKFHAVAFEEAPDDNRSVDLAESVADRVREFGRGMGARIDNRLHLRCELTNPDAVSAVLRQIRAGTDLVSLVTHVPGEGQFADGEAMKKRYMDGGEVTEAGLERLRSQRTGVSPRRLRRAAKRVLDAATDAGVPVASHDDDSPVAVERAHDLGVAISEFPLSMAAARRATDLGMPVVMGAPNVVRDGSLWNGPNANRAIRAGLVDVLCSDFRPQSMLSAVFVDNGDTLPERVRRVAAAPAAVAGLSYRGRLEPGCRADIVVVDPDPTPSVSHAFVAGREVYRSVTRRRR